MSYLDTLTGHGKMNSVPLGDCPIVKEEEEILVKNLAYLKEKADRYNEGKLKWSMVHFPSMEPMVRVLMYGAEKKYSLDNWKKGLNKKDTLDSMMRHMTALMNGEEIDPESQEQHIGHLLCNCMFYSYFSNGFHEEAEKVELEW